MDATPRQPRRLGARTTRVLACDLASVYDGSGRAMADDPTLDESAGPTRAEHAAT